MLAAFNLSNCLIPTTNERAMPLTFNQRTGHQLSPELNTLQEDLLNLEKYASDKQLKIKESKTEVMKFNFSQSYDFPPEFKVGHSNSLEVKSSLKILGVMVQDDLRWGEQVTQMSKKASRKMEKVSLFLMITTTRSCKKI